MANCKTTDDDNMGVQQVAAGGTLVIPNDWLCV